MNILAKLGTYLTKLVQLPLKLWKGIKSLLNSLKHLIIRMSDRVKLLAIQISMFPGSLIGSNKDTKKKLTPAKPKKGKAGQKAKLEKILAFFSAANKANLKKMFDLQKVIVLAKLKLINILNKLNRTKTFLKTSRGYRSTGQEGYVAIDKLGGDAVKIVDRMEFSFANFSPNILKGWDKPGR